jgi:branched-chain amino acid transport system permease protein
MRGRTLHPRLPIRVVGLLVAFGAVLALWALPAGAQEGESGETVVGGTIQIRATTPDEENAPVEGVEITITTTDGVEIGTATTGADGVWSLVLPDGGEYLASFDQSTLPEGVSLRDPERATLDFRINAGSSRKVLFPLGDIVAPDTDTIQIVQLTVDGIKLGMIIAMSAIGLSLIYGTTGLVNFAHGEMVTFGAMVAYILSEYGLLGGLIGGDFAIQLIIAGLLTFVLAAAAGGLFNELVWKRLRKRGASLISMLVVSIGFSIMFRYIMLFQFGGRVRRYRDYQIQDTVDLKYFSITPKDIFIIVFSALILIGVGLALQRTRLGKATRAVADNRDLAESSGIDVEHVIRTIWIAGGGLAGLGGVLFGLTETVGWEMGFRLLLLMFAGVTLGGLGTAYGALLGSLVVGIFIQTSTLFIPTDMKNVGALVILAVILLIRPQGLMGRAERVG